MGQHIFSSSIKMMIKWLGELSHGCLNLLFPPVCKMCNKTKKNVGNSVICEGCVTGIVPLAAPFCSSCGTEIYAGDDREHLCGNCLKNCPPFTMARSLFHYGEEIRLFISTLKYQKDTSVMQVFSELTFCCDLSGYMCCDYIVPVPLHRKRVQQRGFNQSLLLARACFGQNDDRINPFILERTVHTVPQVSLEGVARRKSLKNVFRVNASVDVSESTICLIDDVYTTGTTVSECSRALIAAGAAQVLVLTLARVKVPYVGR